MIHACSYRSLTNEITIKDFAEAIPLVPIDGKNHGTILSDPGDDLADLVDSALQVASAPTFTQWIDCATKKTQRGWRSTNGSSSSSA